MVRLELLAKKVDTCVASAKTTVIASFDEDITGTRQKAVDTFWALKDLQDSLTQLLTSVSSQQFQHRAAND